MIRLVTRGRYTHEFAKRLLDAPEDREPAVRKLYYCRANGNLGRRNDF